MRRVLVPVAVLVAVVLAGSGLSGRAPTARGGEESVVPGASPSGSPSASASPSASPGASPAALTDPCDLWTAEEVSAALGGGDVRIDDTMSSATNCAYLGTRKAGSLTQGLVAGLAFGDASTGSLIDVIRQSYPDSEELDLGGILAIPGTTIPGAGDAEGWSVSSLFVLPDPMVVLALQATAPIGVDAPAALVSLAELAAPVIATIRPPSATPSPSASPGTSGAPAPSGEPRTGLAALFPTDIGGSPTSIDTELTGPEFLAQIVNFQPMEQRVTRALRQRDRKVGDLSFVIGGTNAGSLIAAFQVKGGPIKPLVNALLASLDMQRTGQAVPSGDVAGKGAFEITGGFLIGTSGYAYPKDEVLWLVFSFAPEVTEIFEKLP